MKIAIIAVGVFPGKNSNGIPAFISAIEELSKEHEVVFYSFIPTLEIAKKQNLIVRSLQTGRLPQRLQFLLLTLLFARDHLKARFNIIHAQSPFPAGKLAHYLSKIFSVPWILSFHAGEAAAMPEVPYGDLLNPYLKQHNVEVSRKARLILSMSQHQAQMIRENIDAKAKIIVLPRGINVGDFHTPHVEGKVFRFVHISYHQPVKDPTMLLKSFQLIAQRVEGELCIIGGNYGEEFESMIERLGLTSRVKVIGILSNADTMGILERAHVLLHTSRCEGLPMVALEAMSKGVIVCGTHVGIMADLSGSCCVTVPVGDHKALAERVIDLCENWETSDMLRRNAYAWVKEHDVKWYVTELLKCYRESRKVGKSGSPEGWVRNS
jgi:glycosyltransferase involved in cell wall biosynthesis